MSKAAGNMQKARSEQGLFGHLFLSAGAMKAGTTWMYSVLERHPELHFTPEKELHYFYHRYVNPKQLCDSRRLALAKERYIDRIDPDVANPDRVRMNLHWVANYLSRPVDDYWYRNLFLLPPGGRYMCDFSNLHAHLPEEAWRYIHANSSCLRVMYTMRHPVKRLWSHVKFHLQVVGQLELLDSWGPDQMKAFLANPFMWDNAEYGAALKRMQRALPEECLMPVFYEDMRADPRGFLANVERFLGIPEMTYPDALVSREVNSSAAIPMPDFFPELVADDVARITAELRALGVTPPKSWNA